MRMLKTKSERHQSIRRVLRKFSVKTQGALLDHLAREEAIQVTQATLSRDLAELGVLRVSRPEGAIYELEPVAAQATPQQTELGQNIQSIADNESLVVVRTRPGMASAIALAIDNARLGECLGTLAGDDTLFATPSRGTQPRRLAQQIRNVFGRENT